VARLAKPAGDTEEGMSDYAEEIIAKVIMASKARFKKAE